ncbi:MAG: group 1 truncated hemoglobin [Planctomycetes bacterium]|nr:group 1 truncated hemoglobin [Planctomycetota bacterium]
MKARILLAVLLLAGSGSLARADEKPLDRAEVDKRVVYALYDVALTGTEIFNKGGYAECLRLYQGALVTVVPLLDHRPKLQAKVQIRLKRAADNLKDGKWKPADAAFELRTAMEEIQDEIAPSKDAKKTMWDRFGGEAGVRKVVDDFIFVAAEDKKVDFFRGGKVKLDGKGVQHLKQTLVELISEHTGGPLKYTGKSMKDAHKDMKITDAEFDALRDILVATLKKHKVSDEDIAALGKVVESTRKDIVEAAPPKK